MTVVTPGELVDGMAGFGPDLLVYNDTDEGPPEAPERIARVEVLYSDGMDVGIPVNGRTREAGDVNIDELLRVADEVEDPLSARAGR